ncbi:helix-turn-helix domain-containing protein [Chryseobacterium sp. c4a]|uniref:helix-turn-helix domain-containing protein n=1 Tax=Chryseobacterium sp. c4a TaxID=1573582 RepID=UPI00135B8C72|nr:helix-turn-helix domain-containing protein [Chryseobacterium sp. c4a]
MISAKKTLIFLIFLCINIYSQNNFNLKESKEIDSLIKMDRWDLVHFKLSNEDTRFKRLSKYELFYHYLIKLDSASVLYKKEKYIESRQSILATLKQIDENKEKLNYSHHEELNYIGISRLFYIEKRLGNIGQGLQYLELFSKGMRPIYKKKQSLFIAVTYRELGNYRKSIDILNTRLYDLQNDKKNELYSPFLKKHEIAAAFNNKAESFIKWFRDVGDVRMLDSAYYNYKKASVLMSDSPQVSSFSKTLHISRKAEIAMLRKKYSKALILFNHCQKDTAFMKKSFSREAVLLGKAEAFTFINKPDSAFLYIDRLNKTNRQVTNTHENRLKIYHLLSINYENINDNKKAYQFAKLSLAEIARKKQWDNNSSNFLGKYEQNGIETVSKVMIQENQKNIIFLIALVLLSSCSVVLGIFYWQNQRKKSFVLAIPSEINTIDLNEHCHEKSEKGEQPVLDDELIHRILYKLEMMEAAQKFLSNNFKLSYVAKQLNTNTAYLSQIINHHKGVTFSEYSNNLRIDYVLRELQENSKFRKYTIQTIAEEVGYKSSTTFIKAFKDRVNMKPSDYIKQLDNILENDIRLSV